MSEQTPTEYEHDDGCTDCIESGPPRRLSLILGALIPVLLAAVLWTLQIGSVNFTNTWGMAAGLATVVVVIFLPARWSTSILVGVVIGLAFGLWASDDFNDAFSTALLLAGSGVAAAAVVVAVLAWREAGYGAPWRRDSIRAEVKDGYDQLDAYLSHSAEHMSRHTIAHMTADGQPRKMIGLSGYAGAGKDTAAAGLIYDLDYTRVAFADKLRAFALAVDDEVVIRPGEPYYDKLHIEDGRPAIMPLTKVLERLDGDWTEAKKIPAIRRRLQRIGTDAGRKVIGENVWVDAVMADLPDGPIVFTDTRFPNEAQGVLDRGGYVVRVSRPGVTAVNAHPSETALDDWDFDGAVLNEGTPAETREQMRMVEGVLYGAK